MIASVLSEKTFQECLDESEECANVTAAPACGINDNGETYKFPGSCQLTNVNTCLGPDGN